MKDDPRERIETKRIRCAGTPGGWSLGQVGTVYAALADWPEVVAFATAILAANESWLDAQTQTLEELLAEYPDWRATCVCEAWRRWAREVAESAGWEVQGD